MEPKFEPEIRHVYPVRMIALLIGAVVVLLLVVLTMRPSGTVGLVSPTASVARLGTCPDPSYTEQSCDFDEVGAKIRTGVSSAYLCVAPLPAVGNYLLTFDDGSHTPGAGVRSVSTLFQAKKGERKRVSYYLRDDPKDCYPSR